MDKHEYLKTVGDNHFTEMMHRMEVQNQLGQSALKSMMLVNGGAIIALLTFIGNEAHIANASYLKCGLSMFGAGLFLSLLAYFAAYLGQADFMNVAGIRMVDMRAQSMEVDSEETPEIFEKRGMKLLWAAIGLLFGSLLLFGLGAVASINGIL